jgi:putative endonuclease
MFVTYILYSDSVGRYYIKHCADLDNRLNEHNSGETRSVRYGIPWRIIWSQACETKGEAMKLENKIKKRGAGRFFRI